MKSFTKKIIPLALLAFIVPSVAFAQTLGTILATIGTLLDTLIPILITLAVIIFIYGVIQYITASEPDTKEKARNVMIYGIIGIFVILSIFGIVRVLQNTFGVQGGGTLDSGQDIIEIAA